VKKNKTLASLAPAAFAMAGLFIAPSAFAVPRFVDGIGTCRGAKPCYATVVEAVAAARPGDAIRIFPGVYREAVVIDSTRNNLVLMGHIPGMLPIIAAPDDGTVNAITIAARAVQVRGLIIEAPDAAILATGLEGGTNTLVLGNMIFGRLVFNGCSLLRVTNNSILGSVHIAQGASGCLLAMNTITGGVEQPDGSFTTLEVGSSDAVVQATSIRQNVVRGGSLLVRGLTQALRNRIELNWVEGGGITLAASQANDLNTVRANNVRDGEIRVEIASARLGRNMIDANFTAGSPGDGIVVVAPQGGTSFIRGNTAVDASNCDINDTSPAGGPADTWMNNVFRSPCGAATR
jgi:hypothetical protein